MRVSRRNGDCGSTGRERIYCQGERSRYSGALGVVRGRAGAVCHVDLLRAENSLVDLNRRKRHHPPPGRRIAPPDDRLRRVLQYCSAAEIRSGSRGVLATPLSRSITTFYDAARGGIRSTILELKEI